MAQHIPHPAPSAAPIATSRTKCTPPITRPAPIRAATRHRPQPTAVFSGTTAPAIKNALKVCLLGKEHPCLPGSSTGTKPYTCPGLGALMPRLTAENPKKHTAGSTSNTQNTLTPFVSKAKSKKQG